ncbi:MAG TPA: single-stranded DNA-binding protein [Oculatellaceae cyanobacterium]
MSLSKIVISGRVTRAPEKRFTQQNTAVTEFVIAVESASRNDAPPESAPVRVLTYRDLAERCATEIKKGDLVAVDGRLQINNSQGSDGQRKRDVEIDAVAVENLSAAVGTTGSSAGDVDQGSSYKTPVKAAARPAPASKGGEDLDAIFASDDEIPF